MRGFVRSWPVGSRRPVCSSIEKTTTLSAALIGNQQNRPDGSIVKLRGQSALSRDVFDQLEFAGALIDLENDDAVVTAIRSVEKLA